MKSAAPPRLAFAALALAALVMFPAQAAAGASRVALSPLNNTPDASPRTQISFLGVPSNEIAQVSVDGSESGHHGGRLESYVSSPGASFLPRHPFVQGERVTVSAIVGPRARAEPVRTSFTIARLSSYEPPPSGRLPRPRSDTNQSFLSQPALHPPKVAITTDTPYAEPGDVFVTPTNGLGQSGPMILNQRGGVVWYKPLPASEVAANLQVQSFRGRPVLTWWHGRVPSILGVGFGTDEIYSTTYAPIASVSGGNGYRVDLHEFQITPEGSALVTAYSLVDADLSSVGGPRKGVLQDAILQEIDLGTGLVMFEWHAEGHVKLSLSYSHLPHDPAQPWDFFHLNSISLDPWGDGNLILSSRNTWAAYEIDRSSGAVLWRLGGKRSSFKMGPGTGTAWQHDVRWQPDRTLTIFDNGGVPAEHSQSRVIHERIDWSHRKVTLVGRDVRTPVLLSGSQGDDQVLPGGNSFVGWGEAPYFTEFSATGEVLYEGHIAPPGQSYRAFRFAWSATPASLPTVAVSAKGATATVYASWNGATDVAAWRVLAGASTATLGPIAIVPRTGFETSIAVPSSGGHFEVQALGAGGEVLGSSGVAVPIKPR